MTHPITTQHAKLQPGDTLLVTTNRAMPEENVEALRAYVMKQVPPGVFALVLPPCMTVSVLGENAPFERECEAADELMRLLGLEPEQCRTEGGAINLPRVRSLLADKEAAPFGLEPWEEAKLANEAKNAAYRERNQLVALLARLYPSGIAQTPIEGWDPAWHGCVYIDLPTGQASWHFHTSEAHLFADLPPYAGSWDGHTTEEKYQRVAALAAYQAEAPDHAVEINRLRNVIQAACSGGLDHMIERWKVLFPDAPVPTVRAGTSLQQAEAMTRMGAKAEYATTLAAALRQHVRDLYRNLSPGGENERGEVSLLDLADDWLDAKREGLSPAAIEVLTERYRQISIEGWTPEHDDEHTDGSLSQAAMTYLDWVHGEYPPGTVPISWPPGWSPEWFKPGDDERNLTKACALILAELDRRHRATRKEAP